MAKPFLYIYDYFTANRKVFFTVFISLFLITGFFAMKIKPEEDISKILPRDRQSVKLNELFQNARFADKLVLMVSMKDSSRTSPETLAGFSDSFSSALQTKYPELIRSLEERVNDSLVPRLMDLVNNHLPVFLEPEDYIYFDSLDNKERLKEILSRDIQTLSSPAGFLMKSFISRDPLGIMNPALKKIRQIQYDDNFDLYDGHVISRDGRYMLLFVSPAFPPDNTGKNGQLLKGMDKIIAGLQQTQFPSVNANYFGGVAVAAGNAAQLRADSILTLGITSLFLILFISWYFKKKRAPLLILLPVILGALFSLCIMYWIKGTISVIALAAGSIVLGIAINYSLHVYNHFRHRRDMRAVLDDLAFPLTIGGLTTIGGFFCLQFVQSEILKDLGLFAAFCLIGASLSSLIFLPHLIPLSDANISAKTQGERGSWILRLSNYHPEKNKWLVGLIFIMTIVFAFFVNRVGFDQDMMHMNYMPEKLKTAESTLNKINDYSLRSVYIITEGSNLETALNKQQFVNTKIKALQQNRFIKKSSGIFRLLISDSLQEERIKYWNNYWTIKRKSVLLNNLENAGKPLGFRESAFQPFNQMLNAVYKPLNTVETKMLRNGFANEYIIEKPGHVELISLVKAEPEYKKHIYEDFSSVSDVTVIDRQYMTSKLLDVVTADFNQIGWMVSLLVFGVLLLTYGRIELSLVSFIPMVIAFIWILGIMGLAGLQFNIVNIILSALIFGLGDDYSLFIMDGLLQEYKTGKKNLSSYKSSIVLSAITTLAGLGVLIFAKHPALRSLAFISITGILSVVLIAQVLIPFFFDFLIRNRIRSRRFPWTAAGLFKSVFSLSYFAFGSLLVTVLGFFLIKLNPFAKSRSKYLYHRILSAYTWSVLYIMGNVKKKIINPQHENFSKPVVLIANHQSFLDILIMTMLYPKTILLTNNWVWNSPIFGWLVRMAGYYPVARGIENSIDYLEEQVKAGYSIAVFPEGTRSPDDHIRRFHKGAFFIAEKLNLDILPVMIHGTGYTMSKGDFLLKDGFITIKYLPRVKAGDLFFGVDYTERAKYLGRYFRQQYAKLKEELELPRYFREKLIYNYIYKGPVLEWYLRVKIRLEKDYKTFHDLLPVKGRILDIGCGYGFMSYMLQFAAQEREITGYDYDEEKIEVANHCFSRNKNVRFFNADINQIHVGPADAIILSDVLHYLQPDQQELLLQKCMNALQGDGILLIRDGNCELKKR
ncbi:MAG TPA: 1-acyl-sn-glycerol-3-phosphate acyltransferase, partial [Puia sp.]|nr:1-acyl-sn-glycerol-3-phosphate acyltransferase [Puia sp.]